MTRSPLVGYHKKGYPKQKPKNGLDPKQKLERQTGSQPKISDSPEAPSPRPQKKYRFSDSPEASSPRSAILRLARGPLAADLGRPPSRHRPRPGHRSSVSREAGTAALRCLSILPSL